MVVGEKRNSKTGKGKVERKKISSLNRKKSKGKNGYEKRVRGKEERTQAPKKQRAKKRWMKEE